MRHTKKTHLEFYNYLLGKTEIFLIQSLFTWLPIDIYQTAKGSKLLLMMKKGVIPIEHKGKSLSEIEFYGNLENVAE